MGIGWSRKARGVSAIVSRLSGRVLHRNISAVSWCVSRQDLYYLRCEVEKAIRNGRVIPTDVDQFDPADTACGPSIYTVCEQYIKPVTMEAGKMSWALMRNPSGLECDIFVTHAWEEGIFEFIDKVLASWPFGAKHAWCCMLAIPQNLEISDMIKDPRESPFALALKNATYMLIVPNSKSSIYSRLWCAYEAYLAYSWKKNILAARSPISIRKLFFEWAGLAFFICCGFILHDKTDLGNLVGPHGRWLFSIWIVLLCFIKSHFLKFVIYCIMCLSLPMGTGIGINLFEAEIHKQAKGEHPTALTDRQVLLWSIWDLVLMSISLYDWEAGENAIRSREELMKGYSGSIYYAKCSNDEDEKNIWKEIRHEREDVDEALQILMRSSVSSPELLLAIRKGVDVAGLAHVHMAPCLIAYYEAIISNMFRPRGTNLQSFNAGLVVAWTLVVASMPKDKRKVALVIFFKLFVVFQFVPFLIVGGFLVKGAKLPWARSFVESEVYRHMIQLISAICFSAFGLGSIVKIPVIGIPLAKFFAGRNLEDAMRMCRPRENTADRCEASINIEMSVGVGSGSGKVFTRASV